MSDTSVYERVLGDAIDGLDPGLRRYFGALPPGSVGTGHGVFAVAGSRLRALWPLWRFLAWRRVLFPEFGHRVPFTVVNTAQPDGSLTAVRTVAFGPRRRVMLDRMTVERGMLVDRIGRRGGLDVTVEVGALRLSSRRIGLRLGRVCLPLTRFAGVTVHERAACPAGTGARPVQAVDVRITMPMLGEVFRYAGTFTYAVVPVAGADAATP